jgi:uncharacterized cupin superfamily protein
MRTVPSIVDPVFDEPRTHPGFECLRARLGGQAGSKRVGLSLWEVEPGAVVAFDVGDGGAHQIVNRGEETP